MLSTYDDDELVFEAIRAGAQAYLLKDASEAEVLDTTRCVHTVAGASAAERQAATGLITRNIASPTQARKRASSSAAS